MSIRLARSFAGRHIFAHRADLNRSPRAVKNQKAGKFRPFCVLLLRANQNEYFRDNVQSVAFNAPLFPVPQTSLFDILPKSSYSSLRAHCFVKAY